MPAHPALIAQNAQFDGFDVAIRAGVLQNSDLMSRSIGHADRLLVASPEYVASRATPAHPIDLENWDWLHFSMRPERTELIWDTGASASVVCGNRIEVDSAYALYEFAIRGLGLTPLPDYLANRGFESNELVRVLPEWSIPSLVLHAVWPDRSRRESLTLIFVRFLADKSNSL